MKRNITALVIAVTIAVCFTGCASRSNSSNTNAVTTTVTTTAATEPKVTTVTTRTPAVTTTTSVTTKATTTTTSKATTTTKSTTTKPTIKGTTAETTTTAVSTTAETTTTTTAKKAEPAKKRVKLYVQNIQQCPELPMGCEAVSGSIALKWYGFKVDKFSLLPYQPMMESPKNGVWGDPNKVFVGNPRTYKWGCYSPVIKKAIEGYFEANNVTDYEVISLDGSVFTDLYKEIDNDNPIILWVTTWMQDVERGDSWKLEDGSTFVWTKHEHCVCLIGYDTQKDTVIISDPYDSKGTVEYPRATVEKVYKQLGNMALVIHKK